MAATNPAKSGIRAKTQRYFLVFFDRKPGNTALTRMAATKISVCCSVIPAKTVPE
jgi:hypothetical protein